MDSQTCETLISGNVDGGEEVCKMFGKALAGSGINDES